MSCGCRFDEDDPDADDPDEWDDVAEPWGVDANGMPTASMWLGDQQVIVYYGDVPDSDLTTMGGIRLTTPLRTVIDLAAELDRDAIEEIVADCLTRGLFTVEQAWRRLAEPDMRTYPGAQVLRRVLSAPR